MADIDPIETLRRAARVAHTVGLPVVTAQFLAAEYRHLVSGNWSEYSTVVASAREVLALAEQQQTRPVPAWRVGDDPGADRALMLDAAEYVINGRHASVSAMQRNIRVGFAKAGQLMDLLETWGIVGPAEGSMARKVLAPREHLHDVVEAIRGGEQ